VLQAPDTQRYTVERSGNRISYVHEDGESPLRRARRLRLSPGFALLSKSMRSHLVRLCDPSRLPGPVIEILDQDFAPLFVCRWVGAARWLQDRVVRLALALLMRQESQMKGGWAWAHDRHYATAEVLFWKAPQARRLVKAGVLTEPGRVPAQGGQKFNAMWAQTWEIIQREFATIDRDTFMRDIKAVLALKKRRRVLRKPPRLDEGQRIIVDALDTLKRAAMRGEFTLDEASIAMHKSQLADAEELVLGMKKSKEARTR
jgi:hypothetical protein